MARRDKKTPPVRDVQAVGQTRVEKLEFYQGLLPHPDILQGFETVVPGSAKIIVEAFQSQSSHRQQLEVRHLTNNTRMAWLGMVGGFIISMTVIVGGLLLVWNGKSTQGFAAMLLALGYVLGALFYGRKQQADERAAKRRRIP